MTDSLVPPAFTACKVTACAWALVTAPRDPLINPVVGFKVIPAGSPPATYPVGEFVAVI